MTARAVELVMIAGQRWIAFALLALSACGGSLSVSTNGPETITGSERVGWDQPAADAGELASFRYAVYVDEARNEAADVSCSGTASSGRFACTSALPPMTAGTHTLQVAAFIIDAGVTRESSRSASLRVTRR